MKNITKNVLIDLTKKINEKQGRPTSPYVTNEDGSRVFAPGHITVDMNNKRYNLVVTTNNGYLSITNSDSTSREMEKFLSGYLLGISGDDLSFTSDSVEGENEVLPVVEVSSDAEVEDEMANA